MTSSALTTTWRRGRLAGERGRACGRTSARPACPWGSVSIAGAARLHAERGDRQGDEQAAGRPPPTATGGAGRASTTRDHRRDSPRCALERVRGTGCGPCRPVAQHGQQRRQDGQRADHRRRRRRGSCRWRSAVNVGAPARYMPAIAVITVRPETSTARPEVAAAASMASSFVAPRRALLAGAAQVEQRVVDADREADQQHDVAIDSSTGASWLTRPTRPIVADDGGDARAAPGCPAASSAPKANSRIDERDRQRRSSPALVRSSAKIFVNASSELAVAELLDAQVGVRRLRPLGRRQDRRHLRLRRLGVARDVEAHERRVAVARDRPRVAGGVGGLDVRDVALGGAGLADVLDGGAERGIVGTFRGRLDEDLLARGLREGGLVDLVGALGLADDGLLVGGDRPRPDALADASASTTNASQPNTAFLRCCALQRPARAAKFCLGMSGAPWRRWAMGALSHRLAPADRGSPGVAAEGARRGGGAASARRPVRRDDARRCGRMTPPGRAREAAIGRNPWQPGRGARGHAVLDGVPGPA